MVWVRIEDTFPEHPAIERAGPLGLALHVAALAYNNRNLADGFLPADRVARLLALDDVAAVTAALVAAGVWRAVEGGYLLELQIEHQPTRAKVEQVRRERAKAGRIGGRKSGQTRRASREAKPKQLASRLVEPRPVASNEATTASPRSESAARDATPPTDEWAAVRQRITDSNRARRNGAA